LFFLYRNERNVFATNAKNFILTLINRFQANRSLRWLRLSKPRRERRVTLYRKARKVYAANAKDFIQIFKRSLSN
jgi:hypothetical protein